MVFEIKNEKILMKDVKQYDNRNFSFKNLKYM